MPEGKLYAVKRGRKTGVFDSWEMCEQQVKGYPGALFKSFKSSEREAMSAYLGGVPAAVAAPQAAPVPKHSTAQRLSPKRERSLPAASRKRGRHDPVQDDEAQRDRTRQTKFPNLKLLLDPISCVIYTDGACASNGQGGNRAKAGYGVYYGHGDRDNASVPLSADEEQTNNRAELGAVIHALEHSDRRDGRSLSNITVDGVKLTDVVQPLVIFTDSAYVVGGANRWIEQWKKGGKHSKRGAQTNTNVDASEDRAVVWKTASGEEVKNLDQWKQLDGLLERRRRRFGSFLEHLFGLTPPASTANAQKSPRRSSPSKTGATDVPTPNVLPTLRRIYAEELQGVPLKEVADLFAVRILKVSGHSGVAGNEAADRLAVEGAKKPPKPSTNDDDVIEL